MDLLAVTKLTPLLKDGGGIRPVAGGECFRKLAARAMVREHRATLVAAVGRTELVRGDWIRPGAAVLDVGINRGEDGKLRGDVAFEEARTVAGWLTPVPGGVGPMTIAMLLSNTAKSAARRAGIEV